MHALNGADQARVLGSEVIQVRSRWSPWVPACRPQLAGDSWARRPGAVQWTSGKGATLVTTNHDVPGLFINRHQNLAGWVGQGDDLRLVSAAQGQDLKYVLLRLQRAAAAVEQGVKTLGLQGFKPRLEDSFMTSLM